MHAQPTNGAMHPSVNEVLLTNDDIQAKIQQVEKQLAADYAGLQPIVMCTLKGAVVFCSLLGARHGPRA